jgi:hypothetical protein
MLIPLDGITIIYVQLVATIAPRIKISAQRDRAPSPKPRSRPELEFLTPIIYNRLVGSLLLIS